MTSFSTNIKTNDISSITGDLVASSQTSFSLAPHCLAIPVTAEDLTNKAYVDTRLVNSGSGVNLYFNQTVVQIAPYKQLGTSIIVTVPPTTQNVVINHPAGGTNTLIQSFITDSGFPGTVNIPSGIYVLNQYGKTNVGGTVGTLEYFFILSKRPLVGVDVVLGTSGVSADVNTSVTDIFFAQLSLGAQTLFSTDRLIVNIYAKGTGATNPSNTLTSSYEGNTYSYITTPLVSGSNFLSLNNTFTGSNSFSQTITNTATMPVGSTSSTLLGTMAWVQTAITNALTLYLTQASAILLYASLTSANVFSGTNSFTNSITYGGTTLSNAENSSKIPPTSWVKSVLGSYATLTDLLAYLTIATASTTYVPNSGNTPVAGTKTFSSNILATGIGGATVGASFAFCGSTTSGNIETGNSQTTGVINIGVGNSRTTTGNGGAINIGGGNTCTNNLNLSNGNSYTGIVNIANGLTTGATINLASGTGGLQTTNVNIVSGTGTGTVTIGNSACITDIKGTITIGSNASTTDLKGSVTLNKPLILGTIPTASTQLGYQQDGIINASVILTVAGGIKEIMSITLATAGRYYLQANTAFPSVVSVYNSTSISDSNTVNNTQCQTQMGSSGSGNNYHNISGIFTATAGQIFYILATSGSVPQTMQVVFLRATRIA